MSQTTDIPARHASPQAAHRLDDLAEIIRAYNQVTENLRQSHEALGNEVVRLQEKLASADAQLQRSRRLAALGEMAAGIAHEIRNPLGAISLYAGMLASDLESMSRDQHDEWKAPDAATPVDREALVAGSLDMARKIASAVRGLDAIVSDVLSFARDLRPRLAPVRATDLLDRAVSVSRPAIEAAGVSVRRVDDLRGDADVAIHVDADLIHQALLNVIRNAIEAMTSDKRPAEGRNATAATPIMTVSVRRDSHGITLAIRDNGPGISPEHIDRIFNPFFTTRSTGTGLGLAIVHRIIDAHGGAIAVRNEAGGAPEGGGGGGAVFEIRLPIEQEAASISRVLQPTTESGV